MSYDPQSPWIRCPDCGAALRVTHVAREGALKVTKHSCSACRYKAVSVSQIVVERPRYGQGFDALRKRLRRLPPSGLFDLPEQ